VYCQPTCITFYSLEGHGTYSIQSKLLHKQQQNFFTQNEVVKAVCSSSEKPLTLQQAQTSSAPVNIIGAQVNPPKQFSPSIEKYTRKTKTSETSTTKLHLYSFNSVSPSVTGHSRSDKFCMQTHTKMLISKAKCLQNSKTSRPLLWRPKPDVKLTA